MDSETKQHTTAGADVSEPLRADFILETAEAMQAHLGAFSNYVWAGDYKMASAVWECARLCGKAIAATLTEIKKDQSHG